MAADTFAKLITESLQGLGFPPKELVEIEDGARAVIHALSLLQQHVGFSSQNLNLNSYEWEPASRDEVLTGVPDLAIPAWVERQWTTNANSDQDFWQDVRVCNLAELESARVRGEWNRCAFYISEGQMRIKFSYVPTDYSERTHRLWYSPNVFLAEAFNDTALDALATSVPANFFPLVSGMAELELIPTMRIRAAMSKQENKDLVSALNSRESYLEKKTAVWSDRFWHHVYAERGNRKGGRRRNILPRGMRI